MPQLETNSGSELTALRGVLRGSFLLAAAELQPLPGLRPFCGPLCIMQPTYYQREAIPFPSF